MDENRYICIFPKKCFENDFNIEFLEDKFMKINEICSSFSQIAHGILLEGNYKNFTSKILIHLIVNGELSWEVYEDNIAVRTEWFRMADNLNLRIQHDNGIELKNFPSLEVYTFQLNSEIMDKLKNYIKFSDITHKLFWMELGHDGLYHELFFYRDGNLLNLNWSTSDNLEYYSVAVEFCEYIKEIINPQVIPFCFRETYGIEGELWYDPLERQKLSSESKEFLRRLITTSTCSNGSYNVISQQIGHRKKAMLTNSIDYSSYLVINNEASKRGFQLTFKDLR